MHWKNYFNRASLKITLIYFAVSFLWIFFSDLILLKLTQEETLLTHYQTIKGVGFIGLTSLLIFYLSRREFFKKDESIKAINKAKEEYYALYEEYQKLAEQLQESNESLEDKNQQLRNYFERINESKERYQAFISQIEEGVYRLDLHHPLDIKLSEEEQINYLYHNLFVGECNPRLAELYELNKVEDLIGNQLKSLADRELSKDLYRLIQAFVDSNYNVRDIETRSVDRRGQTRYFNNNITGIVREGKLIRVWGTQQDITSIRRNQQELVEQKEKAEESNRIKNAFLANISHEIRTPLNSIMGFSQLLDSSGLSLEDQKTYIHYIKNSGDQLLRIVSDILDVSFIQTGQLELNRQTFHLNALMRDIRLQMDKLVDQKEKDLKIRVQWGFDDQSDRIVTDKNRLSQVLSNLAENAVKFTSEGHIETGYRLKTQQMLEFWVKDTGIGIPHDKRTLIFDHFRQGEEYANRHYGGIGLGLTIVKGIVEALGGEVSLESQIRQGSVFRFTLPYQQPAEEQPVYEASTVHSPKTKILIVEDQPDNYILLQEYLNNSNISILHAESGEKSLEAFAGNPDIALVLMDLRLPGMDGIQTTRKIKEKFPDIPVVAQTAYIKEQYANHHELFADYLTKPISKESFDRVTKRLLNLRL